MNEFTNNVSVEIKDHIEQYQHALRIVAISAVVIVLIKDIGVDISWWWMLMPGVRIAGLAMFLTYVGFTGKRD